MRNSDPVWEGVYASFSEVPNRGPGFEGKMWVENSLRKIEKIRNSSKSQKTIPLIPIYQESILPIVAGMVYNEEGFVRILDFGGGIGLTYYQVVRSLPNSENLKYHIIEKETVCEAARDFFREEEGIFFHSYFPSDLDKIEIVHMGSSLHYVAKWRETLSKLCAYQSRYFLFTDLTAGDIPTYASAQIYYESRIPVWFFNVNEIIDHMTAQSYRLVFKSNYVSKILGKEQPYPQNNFEERYRLGHPCILLFSREGK